MPNVEKLFTCFQGDYEFVDVVVDLRLIELLLQNFKVELVEVFLRFEGNGLDYRFTFEDVESDEKFLEAHHDQVIQLPVGDVDEAALIRVPRDDGKTLKEGFLLVARVELYFFLVEGLEHLFEVDDAEL